MNECKKTKYTSEQFAKDDLERIRAKSNILVLPRSTYYCKKCNGWHLTSRLNNDESRIIILQQEVMNLRQENAILKSANNKEECKQIKIDETVKKLKEIIKEKRTENLKLRKDRNDLIARIVQLENKPQK
jgi:hypothetical protein